MTFATKRPAARIILPGAALPLCPVLTSAAGRAREAAETSANPIPKGFADASILKAHGTGEWPRGREGSTRVNPSVPALLI